MPCEHTHGSDTSGTMVAGMTSVHAVEQTRMGIAALLVSNISWGVLPLYWHALSGMNAISVLAYRLIATLVVMIALLMAFRRYRAYIIARSPRFDAHSGAKGCSRWNLPPPRLSA